MYWIAPIISFERIVNAPFKYGHFLRTWLIYEQMTGAEKLHFGDSYPQLFDATKSTPLDYHYFYQAVWATERIANNKVKWHTDIGSHADFVGTLSVHTPVVFVDIRPIRTQLPRLFSLSGSILDFPFASDSVMSLSCLHVAEHIGLGRYGDPLNPLGTQQACAEISRTLAPGGNLFFSLPVGRPRVCFNAHRVHSPKQILEYFKDLMLVEFSVVDDHGNLIIHANPDEMSHARYACGLFWFRKGESRQGN